MYLFASIRIEDLRQISIKTKIHSLVRSQAIVGRRLIFRKKRYSIMPKNSQHAKFKSSISIRINFLVQKVGSKSTIYIYIRTTNGRMTVKANDISLVSTNTHTRLLTIFQRSHLRFVN